MAEKKDKWRTDGTNRKQVVEFNPTISIVTKCEWSKCAN